MINYCPNIAEAPLLLKCDIRKKTFWELFKSVRVLFTKKIKLKWYILLSFYQLPFYSSPLLFTVLCKCVGKRQNMSTVSYACCRIAHRHFFLITTKNFLGIHEYFTLIKHMLLKLIVISKNTRSHYKKYETVSRLPCLNYAAIFFRYIMGCWAVDINLKILSFDVSFDVSFTT